MKNTGTHFLKLFIVLVIAHVNYASYAQEFDEIAAKYPNDYAVVQRVSESLTITMKDGQPFGESRNRARHADLK